jgi:DNA-3-methyladenine glycosylase II
MAHNLHLAKDKKLKKLLDNLSEVELKKRKHIYLQLCNSIMSQQLSIKVAAVFQQRFLNLYNGKNPSPKQVLDTPIDTLRSIGLSNAKANYVHNVCSFFIAEKITDAMLHKMSNAEIIKLLTQIKGIGSWTVEMILMFSMAREDVFAVDDLAIQQTMCKLYAIDATDKKAMKAKMVSISNKWIPYRTYACRYLWNSING